MIRKTTPAFTTVTGRKGDGDLFIRSGADGLIVVGTKRPGLKRAYAVGRMSVPEHPFDLGVDRFGMGLDVAGDKVWDGSEDEWRRDSKAVGWYGGYFLRAGATVLFWKLEETRVLEQCAILPDRERGDSVLARQFEFLDQSTAGLSFCAAEPSGGESGRLESRARRRRCNRRARRR